MRIKHLKVICFVLKLIRLIIHFCDTEVALFFRNPSLQSTQQTSSKLLATPEVRPLAMAT